MVARLSAVCLLQLLLLTTTVSEALSSQHLSQALQPTNDSKTINSVVTKKIQGKIKLDSMVYRTECDCADPNGPSSCRQPQVLRIHQEPMNLHLGLEKDELHKVIGAPSKMRMMDARTSPLACSDSRQTNGAIFTPGGGIGEFISALGVYESVLPHALDDAEIDRLVRGWLAVQVYPVELCTDSEAISYVLRHVKVNGHVGMMTGLRLESEVPDVAFQEPLLDLLVSQDAQGDRFLRAMAEHSRVFGVRRETFRSALRSFFKLAWDRKEKGPDTVLLSQKTFINVLSGPRKEQAIVNFVSNRVCNDESRGPLPAAMNPLLLAIHPKAADYYRQALARYFLSQPARIPLNEDVLTLRIIRQARNNLETFVEGVGQVLPCYTVTA